MGALLPVRAHSSAPAKLILCGEHAVVYGRPAIAVPVSGVRAEVRATPSRPGAGLTFDALDLERRWSLAEEPDHPLSELALATLATLVAAPPDIELQITSAIPTASGMGSGAAVATALVRALAAALGRTLPPAQVSALVYASERRFHGTPSGIDNTVVAYEQPIWFVRATAPPQPPTMAPLRIAQPFTLLIGDTGVRSPTRLPVGAVRQGWQADPPRYEALFDAVATIVTQARDALDRADLVALGPLLTQNHVLLQQIGVSSPELDRLVGAAGAAGAAGAKLSGAGWGGIMIALVAPEQRAAVAAALRAAGAVQVLETQIASSAPSHQV